MASETNPDKIPKIIKLNVGGRKFTTSRATLISQSDSMLAAMFSGRYGLETDEEGYYFIDRNGDLFAHLLDVLRSGYLSATLSKELLQDLEREAKYYQIQLPTTSSQPDILRTNGMYYCAAMNAGYCFEPDRRYFIADEAQGRLPHGTYHVSELGMVQVDKESALILSDGKILIGTNCYEFHPHAHPADDGSKYSNEAYTFRFVGDIMKVRHHNFKSTYSIRRHSTLTGVPVITGVDSDKTSYTLFCYGSVCIVKGDLDDYFVVYKK